MKSTIEDIRYAVKAKFLRRLCSKPSFYRTVKYPANID